MRTTIHRDEGCRETRVVCSANDFDLNREIDPGRIAQDMRYAIASALSDMVVEKIRPALDRAIKEAFEVSETEHPDLPGGE